MTEFFNGKADAVAWAKRIIRTEEWYILDFETCDNADFKRQIFPDIVQIGLINKHGQRLVNTLIKPIMPIEPSAIAVHGITEAMVQDAPTFKEVYAEMYRWLNGKVVVAYNVNFEQPVLQTACLRNNMIQIVPLRFTCAMRAYAAFHGERARYPKPEDRFKWQKLGEACKRLSVKTEALHDATSDCFATLGLIEAMANAES